MSKPPSDPRQVILDELESIAAREPEDQAAWLGSVRKRYDGHPQQDEIVEKFACALGAMKRMRDAQVRLARAEEVLEADAVTKIDGVLGGSLQLPETEPERTRFLLYISLLGHFLPNVRSRLEQADAQQFIRAHFSDLFIDAHQKD